MDISIIIPVFEESKKIGRDVEAAAAFLECNHLAGEIIVVDDGSNDNTDEAARNVTTLPSGISLKVIRYDDHKGKGYAIRAGMKETSGEYVMFADSGRCVPYGDILRGLSMLKSGACDIAHGSRRLSESQIKKPQSLYRRVCARVFHWFVVYGMRIPSEFTDTQCGFKIYKGDIGRGLYSECVTDGFMFDVEIIIRAQKLGYKITEFPIEWTCDRDSRLSPTRNLWRILNEVVTIKRTLGNTQG